MKLNAEQRKQVMMLCHPLIFDDDREVPWTDHDIDTVVDKSLMALALDADGRRFIDPQVFVSANSIMEYLCQFNGGIPKSAEPVADDMPPRIEGESEEAYNYRRAQYHKELRAKVKPEAKPAENFLVRFMRAFPNTKKNSPA